MVLQPYPGDELGVIALGYFVTLGPSLVALVWAYFNTSLTPIQLLLLFWFLMTAILFGFYRNIKGIWIGFIYLLTGLRRKL